MTRKYTCKLSLRTKRRNTRRHHGGRGGVLETGATQSMTYASSPAPFAGGKRGIPLLTSFHPKKTRKNRRH